MEAESQHSCTAHHAGTLSLSLGAQCQVATESSPEDLLTLQLNSCGQAVQQFSFDLVKASHGPSCLVNSSSRVVQDSVASSLFQNVTSFPKVLNVTGPEEGFYLTLGCASAIIKRSNLSRCDSFAHKTGACFDDGDDDDYRRHVNVDLALALATSQEDQLTVPPFPTQVAMLEAGVKNPQSLKGLEFGLRVCGDDDIPACDLRAHEKNPSVQEGILGNPPFGTADEIDLQIGLSGRSLSVDSDSLSVDGQEPRIEASAYGHIPLVDEGSTSARLMESGGNYPPFLGCKPATESPRISRNQSCMMPVVASEADALMLATPSQEPLENGSFNSPLVKGKVPSFVGDDESQGLHAHGSETAITPCPTAERTTKKCKFKGCSKGARGASGLCIAHGGGRRCQRLNCSKGAEGRTMFCKAHGGGRRCQTLGCIKSAEGRTDFCIAHGGGRRCTYEGCSKAARGRSGLCIRHGGGKRCQKEGCTKSAEGFSGLCISHGGGRRCQFPDCGKGAQGSTKFCKGHGGGRRCEFEGCTKGAEGSTPFCKAHGGGKRCTFGGGICTKSVHGGTAFCVAHGGGKRCSVTGCTKSARGRTDLCVRHGGGKRCKFEHCNKSAQGSTDYCKAHGGGKRCLWGQEGSVYDGSGLDEASIHGIKFPCEKFARGKAGLCSAHINLLEQYNPGLSSIPNLQGTLMEHTVSKHVQPHSDVSEPTSQLDEESESMDVEHQLKVVGEDSWRPQEQVSSPLVFKAQSASRRCVAVDDSLHNMGDSRGSGNPYSNPCPPVNTPANKLAVVNEVTTSMLHMPVKHVHQTCKPCLQTEVAIPVSRSGLEAASKELQQCTGLKGHSSSSEDPEERVHGGGHFMALCTNKSSG